VNIEQLRAALERIRKDRPEAEGLSCQDIATAIGMKDRNAARPLLRQAVAAGILVPKPYYVEGLDGVTYKRNGLGLAAPTTTTGKKKTKHS
jgi:hypothetical protein